MYIFKIFWSWKMRKDWHDVRIGISMLIISHFILTFDLRLEKTQIKNQFLK